jgi:diphthamide biosynthesis protein 3
MRRDILSTIYTPETCAALARYHDHLQDTRFRLEERRQNTLRELAACEGPEVQTEQSKSGEARSRVTSTKARGQQGNNGKGAAPTTGLATRYARLAQELEDVRLEVKELEEGT